MLMVCISAFQLLHPKLAVFIPGTANASRRIIRLLFYVSCIIRDELRQVLKVRLKEESKINVFTDAQRR